jgi:hypothetical protein
MNTTPKTSRSTSDTLSLPALKGEVSRVKSMKKSKLKRMFSIEMIFVYAFIFTGIMQYLNSA